MLQIASGPTRKGMKILRLSSSLLPNCNPLHLHHGFNSLFTSVALSQSDVSASFFPLFFLLSALFHAAALKQIISLSFAFSVVVVVIPPPNQDFAKQ